MSRREQRGASLVEALVGLSLGGVVAGLAVAHLGHQVHASRAMVEDARVAQDLRSVTDVVLRNLRTAAYWQASSSQGVWQVRTGQFAPALVQPTLSNPHRSVRAPSLAELHWTQSEMGDTARHDGAGIDQLGLRLHGGALQMKAGGRGSWQTLTDPDAFTITAFNARIDRTAVPLAALCTQVCLQAGCPTLEIRHATIEVRGHPAGAVARERRVVVHTRLRNDTIEGACS